MKLSACALMKDLTILLICNQAPNPTKAVVMPAVQAKQVARLQRAALGVSCSSVSQHVESQSKQMGEACRSKNPFKAELESERCSVPFFCLPLIEVEIEVEEEQSQVCSSLKSRS